MPTHKARALMTYAVAHQGKDIARERLLGLFWGASDRERAREGLRTALGSVRKSLRSIVPEPAEVFYSDKSIVRWSAPTDYDVDRFARAASSSNAVDLRVAVQMYGEFLEGNYEEWVVSERTRIGDLYEHALTRLVDMERDAELAYRLRARNPYDETAYSVLISREIALGRHPDAVHLLSQYRAATEEIGVDPSDAFSERFANLEGFDAHASMSIELPFVGRTHELMQLENAFVTQRTDDGFTGLVLGEPGIGKTALLRRAQPLARHAGRRVLTVRCTEDVQRFGTWHNIYEHVVGISLEEKSETTPIAAVQLAQDLLDGFTVPTAIFVDDAHLLSGESLQLLGHLVRQCALRSHVIVVAARPEARERLIDTARPGGFTLLGLGPLQQDDVERAVAFIADVDVGAFAQVLYKRSGGHPLFLLALIQSMAQSQTLRRDGNRWRLVRSVDERLDLPPDLRGSIETRLLAAGEDAAVVACALALEPGCTAEDLSQALDYPEERVLDAIDRLMQFALIAEEHGPQAFRFVHDVVREVSGTLLNAGRRVALHRAFAQLLQQHSEPNAVVRRAHHLRAAGLLMHAAREFLRAAQAAKARSSSSDAALYATRGLSCLDDINETRECATLKADLWLTRASAASMSGSVEEAAVAAANALNYARLLEDPGRSIDALLLRAALFNSVGDHERQMSDAQQAMHLADDAGLTHQRGVAALTAGTAARGKGDVQGSCDFCARARIDALQAGDVALEFAAFSEALKTQLCWWRFADAAQTADAASPAARRLGSSAVSALHAMRAILYYLCDRNEELHNSVHLALQEADIETAGEVYHIGAMLACRTAQWSRCLELLDHCARTCPPVQSSLYQQVLAMAEIDVRLQRNARGDVAAALEKSKTLTADASKDGMLVWNDCKALVDARLAVRLGQEGCRTLLRGALDALEATAHSMPFDCDYRFARLAGAATECGEQDIARRAHLRAVHYRSQRLAIASRVIPILPAALHNA